MAGWQMEREDSSGKFSKVVFEDEVYGCLLEIYRIYKDKVILRKTWGDGCCCERGIRRKTRSTEETSGI